MIDNVLKLSEEEQLLLLTEAKQVKAAAFERWYTYKDRIPLKDVLIVVQLSRKPESTHGGFKEHVAAYSEAVKCSDRLEALQHKLIESSYTAVQDMASEDIDLLISATVEDTDYQEEFSRSDLKNILFSVSKHNTDPISKTMTQNFKDRAKDTGHLISALSADGLIAREKDPLKELSGEGNLNQLTELGEAMLCRLQQLEGRKLIAQLSGTHPNLGNAPEA